MLPKFKYQLKNSRAQMVHSYSLQYDAKSWLDLIKLLPHQELPDRFSKFCDERKSEYLAGRFCAHTSIKVCRPSTPLLSIRTGPGNEPIWPEGLVGSITHSNGFCSAVVAESKLLQSIGIDSELIMTPDQARETNTVFLTQSEIQEYQTEYYRNLSFPEYATLIFSAKESLFKCLYPLVGEMFDFQDSIIYQIDSDSGQFKYALTKSLSEIFPQDYIGIGSFILTSTHVHTGIQLRNEDYFIASQRA